MYMKRDCACVFTHINTHNRKKSTNFVLGQTLKDQKCSKSIALLFL